MRVRGVAPVVLALSVLAVLPGCDPEPEAEVTTGDDGSSGWQRLVDYYHLNLPAGHGAVAWVQTRDIGSNALYLRVEVDDADAAAALLTPHQVRLRRSQPYAGGCADALPRSSGWSEDLPQVVLDRRPASGSPSRCGYGEFTYRRLPFRADALVVSGDPGPVVWLHLSQTS